MSMRILPLNNISFRNNNISGSNSQLKTSNVKEEEHKIGNLSKLAIGLSGSAALGVATYYMFRGKPSVVSKNTETINNSKVEELILATLSKVKSNVEDLTSKTVLKLKNGGYSVKYSSPVKEDTDALRDIFIFDKSGNLERRVISKFDAKTKEVTHFIYKGDEAQITGLQEDIDKAFLVKEVKIEDFKPFIKERLEQNIYITNKDNTLTQYQDFYRNGKLYERYVYNNHVGELRDTDKVLRYNFAYDNGNFASVAKQDVLKDGHQHGIYKNASFEPFPIWVKNNGDKEFKELKDVYTFESLCEFDSKFNPDNL